MQSLMFGIIDATVAYDDLKELITHRLPSAVQFGGRYRLIDFSLSNMKNSGIRNVCIFPNGNYRSLTDHISSGKVWDLDRKRDGLFVLPPKRIIEQSDDIISFNRMKEHLEYFLRSKQKYLILTSGVIVWNINYNAPLKSHIESGANITEILYKNQKLNTYILEKDYLIQLILQHEYLGYKNLLEVIKFQNNIKVNYYYHNSYTKIIKNIHDFYETNMDMLNFDIGKTVFLQEQPILSKTKDSPPTFYGDKANVSNTIVANGAQIYGTIENSIIFRDVYVEEGAVIKNSIVMQSSRVMSSSILEYCILDKHSIIGENVVLRGTREQPIVIEKDEKIISKSKMQVMHVSSECAPFIKTGGLADVLAALPKKQRQLGIDIIVCLPLYRYIKENYEFTKIYSFTIKESLDAIKVNVFNLARDGVNYYFYEVDNFFDRDHIYGYEDDLKRYYYYNVAILEHIQILELMPNIIHLHDYHAGLIPILLSKRYSNIHKFSQIKTLLTIHNIKYQGSFKDEDFISAHLNDVTKDDEVNFLKLGIEYASKITTVSVTYSKEIQFEYFSENLKDVIKSRKDDLEGILNGLDYEVNNPMTDILIHQNYDINSINKKKENKRQLQYECQISMNDHTPLIGMVTRLVEQKGLDLILSIFDKLMDSEDIQFVLLGSGDKYYENELRKLQDKYPNKVRVFIGFDAFNPSQIYAGSDMFLMPSRFEPCGLAQMIALRYGSIPIVRETGGLNDTIKAYNELTRSGNGFSFMNYNAHDMLHTIKRAIGFYKDKNHWNQLINSAMSSDFSYDKTALKYYKLYENILK